MQCSDSSYPEIRNILITISYDGADFHGWQIQNNALSVQEVFQNSLMKIIGYLPDIKGCSRTDSGVHANMYCISTKISHHISNERLRLALNRYLPEKIACLDIKDVPEDFHARYSAKGKEYIYKIWNNKTRNPFLCSHALFYRYDIDIDLLKNNAQDYIGCHDFTSFCTLDSRECKDMRRNVKYFNIDRNDSLVTMTVAADGFLYNMVRIMVGTLLKLNSGKLSDGCITDIIERKNRKFAGPTAPAHGLYLNKVFYGDF